MIFPYFKVDLEKLAELKETYELALETIKDNLPDINLNSRNQVINLFEKQFNIKLNSIKIKEIASHLQDYDSDSAETDMIQGIVYYYKVKYSLKNYINWFLNTHEEGRIYIRVLFGRVTLTNRMELPRAPEILACVTETEGLYMVYNDQSELVRLEYEEEE